MDYKPIFLPFEASLLNAHDVKKQIALHKGNTPSLTTDIIPFTYPKPANPDSVEMIWHSPPCQPFNNGFSKANPGAQKSEIRHPKSEIKR